MMILLIFIIIIIILCCILKCGKYKRNEAFNHPPGPKGLPLIGNLHQYDFSTPHVYLAKLTKTYGRIIWLRLGLAHVVVVQSARLAKEVLKTQDQNFCSRPSMVGITKLSYNGLDIAFSPYSDYFREVKKIGVVHLLNSLRVRSFAPIQHEEISRLIHEICTLSSTSSCINLSNLLTDYAFRNICRIAFGSGYEDKEGYGRKLRGLLEEAQVMFTDMAYADYFPSLGWLLDKLVGKSGRLEKTFRGLDEFYEQIIRDHLHPHFPNNNHQEDLIDVLLHLRKQRSFAFDLTFDHVKAILMNMFVAGTDTSSAMVIWAMTELIKNPSARKKVQDELRNCGRKGEYINEDDLQNLEYFKAVVKETFRLHPAAPLLVAHQAIVKSKIDGYDILPNTILFVNAWAIGRDPAFWNEPDSFMPERFLGSSTDFKGQHFELIPFGAGRRMCPGLHLGTLNFELTLANLLCSFHWDLPIGVNKEDIDTDTLPGITMHKKIPLCLMPTKFS